MRKIKKIGRNFNKYDSCISNGGVWKHRSIRRQWKRQTDTELSTVDKSEQDSANSQGNVSGEIGADESQKQAESADGSRILIAYFTAGENSDVVVVSSASVTTVDGEAKGRLRAVADMIQAKTGGMLFSIQTAEKYPGDGGALIDYAAQEQDEDVRPELTSHIDNLDDYDICFIGFPNWLAYHNLIKCTPSMSLGAFFNDMDF